MILVALWEQTRWSGEPLDFEFPLLGTSELLIERMHLPDRGATPIFVTRVVTLPWEPDRRPAAGMTAGAGISDAQRRVSTPPQ